MKRRFTCILNQWETSGSPEPLLVTGARQVGKTWIIQDFCKNTYEDYVYINLEKSPELRSIFEGSLEPQDILHQLEIVLERPVNSETPLFIDEIQVCERAITSLKYFCEANENYRVIGAGSLLGVKLARFESSFPVGKVRIAQLYPMSFDEFLDACDNQLLLEEIQQSFRKKKPLAEAVHQKALQYYHDYLTIGGMPRFVKQYVDAGKNIIHVDTEFHKSLRLSYLADMTKYTISAAEGVKITEVYDSVPRQLAHENPKFKYSEVRRTGNKRDFSSSLDWLVASGMVLRVDKLGSPRVPMAGFIEKGFERIYLSDIGLLSSVCGLKPRDLYPEADNVYKGAVIENYVMQEFVSYGKPLCYFKPSGSMEIDLMIDREDGICPVEIKSGRNKRSTSLNNYIEKYSPPEAFRLSEKNFGWSETITSLPLYASFCLCCTV